MSVSCSVLNAMSWDGCWAACPVLLCHADTHVGRCVPGFAWPGVQGNQDFNGKQLHSRELTNHRQARGKTVVIVGNGRAPSDIAARVMVAQAARRVIVLNKQVRRKGRQACS